MALKNSKQLLITLAVIMVVLVAYGLPTMKENHGPVEDTGVTHKFIPATHTDGLRP